MKLTEILILWQYFFTEELSKILFLKVVHLRIILTEIRELMVTRRKIYVFCLLHNKNTLLASSG